MGKMAKKVWNIASTSIVAVSVILVIVFTGIRLAGIRPFIVLSGSMEPNYPVGSLILVRKVDCRELKPGNVITFFLADNTVVTHRISAVVSHGEDSPRLSFRTKGDANAAEDGGFVSAEAIIGTPIFYVPYLGFLVNYLQHPPGIYIVFSAIALLLLTVFLADYLTQRKNNLTRGEKTDASYKPAQSR